MQKCLNKVKKRKGIITIEASMIMSIFFLGFVFLINLTISVYVESQTKKALNSMALQLGHFSYIVEELGYLDEISTGEDIQILESAGEIINKGVIDKAGDIDFRDIYEKFKSLLISKAIYNAKDTLSNQILKKFAEIELNNDKGIIAKHIENGLSGLSFKGSKIHEKPGEIELNIEYNLPIKGIINIPVSRKVRQAAYIKTNNEIITSNESNDAENSIWHASNFDRGRFFVEYFKKNTSDIVLKSGQGLDFYNPDTNTIKQMYSLNVFKQSYSELVDGKYIIREESVRKMLKTYYNEMQDNVIKSKNSLTLSDDTTVETNNAVNLNLIIVIPNEAANNPQLEVIIDDFRAGGQLIELFPMENAL